MGEIMKAADISECGTYRYRLSRIWDTSKPLALWVMLNPSTADADTDDNTIRKCIKFTQRDGQLGGLMVGNLYAYRSTDPSVLRHLSTTIARGPENIEQMDAMLAQAAVIICAWGLPGGPQVPPYLRADQHRLWCLGTCKNGAPKHPLYLRDDTEFQRWPACPSTNHG